MKRHVVFVLVVVAVCTPLLFVAFLLTAAYAPALDKVTMAMPGTLRSAVANLALSRGGGVSDKSNRDRILKLDPNHFEARNPGCSGSVPAGSSSSCIISVGDDEGAAKLNALGLQQEREGDPCTAEDTFTKANDRAGAGKAGLLRNMGRAAYECGRFAYSAAEFSAAEDDDFRDAKSDQDDTADLASDLIDDREWLSLAYVATRQPQLANQACLRAHTGWKACRCTYRAKKPACVEVAANSSR